MSQWLPHRSCFQAGGGQGWTSTGSPQSVQVQAIWKAENSATTAGGIRRLTLPRTDAEITGLTHSICASCISRTHTRVRYTYLMFYVPAVRLAESAGLSSIESISDSSSLLQTLGFCFSQRQRPCVTSIFRVMTVVGDDLRAYDNKDRPKDT